MNDGVETSVIHERAQEFGFISVQNGNLKTVNVDFLEPATHFAVDGFTEPFSQEFVVSVVVAENADELAM